jgi:hypothetical protein
MFWHKLRRKTSAAEVKCHRRGQNSRAGLGLRGIHAEQSAENDAFERQL